VLPELLALSQLHDPMGEMGVILFLCVVQRCPDNPDIGEEHCLSIRVVVPSLTLLCHVVPSIVGEGSVLWLCQAP